MMLTHYFLNVEADRFDGSKKHFKTLYIAYLKTNALTLPLIELPNFYSNTSQILAMFLIRLPKILLLILQFLNANKIKDKWTRTAIPRVIFIQLWLSSVGRLKF